jgi:hypothetical protein
MGIASGYLSKTWLKIKKREADVNKTTSEKNLSLGKNGKNRPKGPKNG